MKKIISVLLAIVFVFSAVPFGGMADYIKGIDWSFLAPKASAEGEVYSGTCGTGVNWSLDTGTGVLTISGSGAMEGYTSSSSVPWYSYRSSVKSVVIQNGVTSIGESAFSNCSSLASVTIPDSVTSIGDWAFGDCSSLTSVIIPDSVTSIGNYAFYDCRSLTSVTIPDSVTSIGDDAFRRCDSLTSVTIPDSVTSIGIYAFYDCRSLTSVTIGNGVTSIGNYAFCNCSSLTSVTIGNGVTSIGNYAFNGCSSLTSVTIPDSVTSIGKGVFASCSSLTSVTIPDSVTSIGYNAFSNTAYYNYSANWENNVLYIGNHLIAAKTDISGAYTVKSGTKCIADYAFYNCSSLTSVTIGDSVTSIGDHAFYGCSSLTSVTIPDSVTSIGGSAFEDCRSLTSVTIGNGVTSIGDDAFRDCSSLTSVTIGNGVTSIGNYAFNGCSSLTSVTIGNGVTSIGNYAFCGCSSLTSVTIPDGVTSIGSYAFNGCSSITSVTIPDSVTSIGIGVFEYCRCLTSITIPDSVTSIGYMAFYGCSSLTSVTIPKSVTSIGDLAFVYCHSSLTIYGYSGSYAESYAEAHDIPFKEVYVPSTPTLTVSNASNGVTVKWAKISGAESYIVYRKAGSAASWSRLAVVDGGATTYTDTKVTSGTSYTYTVRAQNAAGASGYNKTGLTTVYLAQPTVTAANANGAVTVKWGKITGATGYIVYRKASGATAWSKLATVKGNTTVAYNDKTVKSGTAYRYTVRAYKGSDLSSYSSTGAVIRYLAQPTVTVANANGSVTVKWSKSAGAKGYYIYRKAGGAKSWSRLATISSGTTVAYADKNVASGTAYQYTVKAYNGAYSSSYCAGAATRYLAAGKITSAASTKTGITVKWAKTAGANGYVVYRKVGSGAWAKLVTVKGNATVSYVDKSAKKGTTYTYCVRPYNGSFAGVYANTVSCKDKY